MLKHRTFIFLIASLLAAVAVSSAIAQERGIVAVPIKNPQGQQVMLYKESHALVIGVSKYDNRNWPTLRGVRDDVRVLSETLSLNGFHVVTVENPNYRELVTAFNDFIRDYGLDPENRLLFYFAGHGYTHKPSYASDDPEEWNGYFLTADTPDPSLNLGEFKARAMSMQRIEELALSIEAKHAMFLFDSCFSGSLFALQRAVPQDIEERTTRPVRQFITAGSADETVPDTSIFRRQFVSALEGEGDKNRDGYVTGSELGLFLEETVINLSRRTQTPQYGKIRHRRLNKGDFVFSLLAREELKESVDSIVELRKQLEQDRLNLEDKRKRVAALQLLNEEKRKLEEEKRRFKEAQDRLARLQPPAATSGRPTGMAKIPGGEFMAGLDPSIGYRECNKYLTSLGCKQEWFTDEGPEHMVLIDTFYMDKYEVTQGEYERAMGSNPSHFKGASLPVVKVSWHDADAYCKKVGKRLPTEAEWEKAAKGRRDTVYPWGNEFDDSKANFCDANCEYDWKRSEFDDGHATTAPVGSYRPNGYGLYDMAGNVWEWVADWYDGNYYRTASRNNPRGPSSGEMKVLRGGSWLIFPVSLRSASRAGFVPSSQNVALGFRCAQ